MRGAVAAFGMTAAIATAGFALEAAHASSSMDDYRWERRPLIVFAPDETHPIRAAQSEALVGQTDALLERDIVFIEVVGRKTRIDGRAAPDLEADSLRRRYGVAADDAVALLVGKDGGVKIRQAVALQPTTLFETIDAMPMRRHEMRQRVNSGE